MKRVMVGLLALTLGGCGKMFIGGNGPSISQSYLLDGVKLIAPWITEGDSAGAYGLSAYRVSSDSRLLLRYESFSKHTESVDLGSDGSKKVIVQVTVSSDPAEARERLELCPLQADWMMLATWQQAHPFGLSGQWKAAGADYDELGCQKAEPVPAAPGPTFKAERLEFDMTQWFKDYPRGSNRNYGWVLLSDGLVKVIGETSASESPRVLFDSFLGR
jgi:hypothetical protein